MNVLFASIRHFLLTGPLTGTDHRVATWFGHHLSAGMINLMADLSQPGSAMCIAIVLSLLVGGLIWRRRWYRLCSVVLMVPGGMLVNSLIKIMVHRHRPVVGVAFPHWDGYSFPSGHTIGATLLYGALLLAIVPLFRRRRWKALSAIIAGLLVLMVGFSRIALGAHYVTDVVGAMMLGSVWLMLCRVSLEVGRRLLPKHRVLCPTVYRIEPEAEETTRLAA